VHDEAAVGARDADILATINVDTARSWLHVELGCATSGTVNPGAGSEAMEASSGDGGASARSPADPLSRRVHASGWQAANARPTHPISPPAYISSWGRTMDFQLALERIIPLRLLLDGGTRPRRCQAAQTTHHFSAHHSPPDPHSHFHLPRTLSHTSRCSARACARGARTQRGTAPPASAASWPFPGSAALERSRDRSWWAVAQGIFCNQQPV
jgi:hypothetical protein